MVFQCHKFEPEVKFILQIEPAVAILVQPVKVLIDYLHLFVHLCILCIALL